MYYEIKAAENQYFFKVLFFLFVQTLETAFTMESLHQTKGGQTCPCTCVAVCSFSPSNVFTGGEDGRICALAIEKQSILCHIGMYTHMYVTMNRKSVTQEIICHSTILYRKSMKWVSRIKKFNFLPVQNGGMVSD